MLTHMSSAVPGGVTQVHAWLGSLSPSPLWRCSNRLSLLCSVTWRPILLSALLGVTFSFLELLPPRMLLLPGDLIESEMPNSNPVLSFSVKCW